MNAINDPNAAIPPANNTSNDTVSGTYVWSGGGANAQREELRLDVDGRYPQMIASGMVRASLSSVANWIARLTAAGPGRWSGGIFYRSGDSGALPFSRVEITVSRPPGSSSPEARMVFGGTSATRERTMKYRSRHFQPVEFEFDVVEGEQAALRYRTCSHPNRPPALPCETLTIQDVFARAGFDVTVTTPGAGIPVVGAGNDNLWSDQEMHDAMQDYWSSYSSQAKWALWTFFAPLHVPDNPGEDPALLGGVMFDDIGPQHRQGTAIFTRSFISRPEPGESDPAEWIERMKFWCTCHEMGHAFNLAHSWQKELGVPWNADVHNEDEARSFMNYPYYVSGGETTFFEDFEYRFSDQELLFMRHAPEGFVQMGNAAWFDDHAFEHAADSPPGLTLELRANREKVVYEFMEPVTLELKLTNISKEPLLADISILKPGEGLLAIIKRDGSPARQFHPYSTACRKPTKKVLMPGESMYESLYLSSGTNGWDLAEPGRYVIQAALQRDDGDLVSNPLRLQVLPPTSFEEEHVAQDFFSDEVGRIVALDGSRTLRKGIDILQETAARLKGKRVALHSELALGQCFRRDFKQVDFHSRRERRVSVAPAREDTAKALLEGALFSAPEKMAASLGHIDYQWYVADLVDWLIKEGEPAAALKCQKKLLDVFQARSVHGRPILGQVIRRIESKAESLSEAAGPAGKKPAPAKTRTPKKRPVKKPDA